MCCCSIESGPQFAFENPLALSPSFKLPYIHCEVVLTDGRNKMAIIVSCVIFQRSAAACWIRIGEWQIELYSEDNGHCVCLSLNWRQLPLKSLKPHAGLVLASNVTLIGSPLCLSSNKSSTPLSFSFSAFLPPDNQHLGIKLAFNTIVGAVKGKSGPEVKVFIVSCCSLCCKAFQMAGAQASL